MEALVAQDYSPLEIVVSDNASTDRTWEILRRFEDDPVSVSTAPTRTLAPSPTSTGCSI